MGGDLALPEEIQQYEKRRGKKQFEGRRGDSHNIFAASLDHPVPQSSSKPQPSRRDDMANVDYVKDVFDQLNEPSAKLQSATRLQGRPETLPPQDPHQYYQRRGPPQQPDFQAHRSLSQQQPGLSDKAMKDQAFMKNVDNFFG